MSDKEAYDAFLKPLITDLRRDGFPGALGRPYDNDRGFKSAFPHLSYRFGFWPEDRSEVGVYLWIHAPRDKSRNQYIYRALRADKAAIDAAMGVGDPLTKADWNPDTWRVYDWGYAAVGVSTPGRINSPQGRLDEIREWVLEYLPRVKEVLDPRLEKILRNLGGPAKPKGP